MSVVYWLGDKLYLNITNRCSNRCYFCIRNFTDWLGGFNLKLRREPSVSEVIRALEDRINRRYWSEIVFCGFGEPTMRLDCLLEVARWIRRYFRIPIRLNTNGHGYIINEGRDVVRELKEAGVSRVSVSLNAHDEETYNRICKPIFKDAYKGVINFIKMAKDCLETEVTAVELPEVDIDRISRLAFKLGVHFRSRHYYVPFL